MAFKRVPTPTKKKSITAIRKPAATGVKDDGYEKQFKQRNKKRPVSQYLGGELRSPESGRV